RRRTAWRSPRWRHPRRPTRWWETARCPATPRHGGRHRAGVGVLARNPPSSSLGGTPRRTEPAPPPAPSSRRARPAGQAPDSYQPSPRRAGVGGLEYGPSGSTNSSTGRDRPSSRRKYLGALLAHTPEPRRASRSTETVQHPVIAGLSPRDRERDRAAYRHAGLPPHVVLGDGEAQVGEAVQQPGQGHLD